MQKSGQTCSSEKGDEDTLINDPSWNGACFRNELMKTEEHA